MLPGPQQASPRTKQKGFFEGFENRRLKALLGTPRAASDRYNFLQIILPEGEIMDRAKYLEDQVVRSERLARSAMDKLTVDRLMEFASDCRSELSALLSEESRGHPAIAL